MACFQVSVRYKALQCEEHTQGRLLVKETRCDERRFLCVWDISVGYKATELDLCTVTLDIVKAMSSDQA